MSTHSCSSPQWHPPCKCIHFQTARHHLGKRGKLLCKIKRMHPGHKGNRSLILREFRGRSGDESTYLESPGLHLSSINVPDPNLPCSRFKTGESPEPKVFLFFHSILSHSPLSCPFSYFQESIYSEVFFFYCCYRVVYPSRFLRAWHTDQW